MSLYKNFTIREWLALHCDSKDIDDLFRKALKENDEPMAVLALAELTKRGDTDLVSCAISDATKEGHLAIGTHFSEVFANALRQIGSRDPLLKLFGKYHSVYNAWPETMGDLLDCTTFADCDRPAMQNLDKRLGNFLASFAKDGWFSVEIGITELRQVLQIPGDYYREELIRHHFNIVVKNGLVLNMDEIPNVLDILDEAGITDPLPEFHGEELTLYTFDEDGNWIDAGVADEKEDLFYVTYHSLR